MEASDLPFTQEELDRTPPRVLEYFMKRIAQLEARVKELEHRLNLNSSNSSKPPSTDPPDHQRPPKNKSKRKRGGQPGHPRHTRPIVPADKVSQTVECKPGSCRVCGETLEGKDPHPQCHQVAEIPPIEPTVVEYRLHKLVCRHCGAATRGTLPKGVLKGAFGPRLAAVLSLFAGAYRLSKRQIQQLSGDLFGLTISTGMICKLERRTAEMLSKPYEELKESIKTQSVNADETGWKENKRKAWLWVVVTAPATVFRIARTRGGRVIGELLGRKSRQIVGCDRAKMYHQFPRIQWCWAHLIRNFQAMIDRCAGGQEIGEALRSHCSVLFEWWQDLKAKTITRATFRYNIGLLKNAFHDDLELGCKSSCKRTAATCRALLAGNKNLWTFAKHEGIEPTNNAAERALRFAVIWRRISHGTDSSDGSRFVERILSIVATCRQQARNVLEYLVSCQRAQLNDQPTLSLLPAKSAAA